MENPYRYSTKEWDEKSGLYYFGARYYSPEIGRWTQRDPAGTVDGLNLYFYVANDPGSALDPFGRYRRNVHYDLTRRLAESAGFPPDIAAQIARCDQGIDDNHPAGLWGDPDNALWHFTDQERRLELRGNAFDSCDPCALGRYLHALQDSFSHRGKGPVRHAHSRIDYMAHEPERAADMASLTLTMLSDFNKKCCKTGALSGLSTPKQWADVEGWVEKEIRNDVPPWYLP